MHVHTYTGSRTVQERVHAARVRVLFHFYFQFLFFLLLLFSKRRAERRARCSRRRQGHACVHNVYMSPVYAYVVCICTSVSVSTRGVYGGYTYTGERVYQRIFDIPACTVVAGIKGRDGRLKRRKEVNCVCVCVCVLIVKVALPDKRDGGRKQRK